MARKKAKHSMLSLTDQCDAWVSKYLSGERQRILPHDPGGLNAAAAVRGQKAIDLYCKSDPGAEEEEALFDLLHDLLHLCDRKPNLGSVGEKLDWALRLRAECIWESSTPSELKRLLKRS